MDTINNYFRIPLTENVLSTSIYEDTKMFVDPLKIDRRYTSLSKEMSLVIEDFYMTYINDPIRVLGDVENNYEIFREPYENHLGYCDEGYHGKGGGKHLADQLRLLLPELRKANVQYFRHISFMFSRVSDDVTSDLATRIIFKQLAIYTLNICRKYDIQTAMSPPIYYWDHINHIWMMESFELPLLPGGDIMVFIPKDICSSQVSMNHFKRFAIMGIVKYFMNHWNEINYKINCQFSLYRVNGKKLTQKDFIEELLNHNFDIYDVRQFLELDEKLRDNIIKFYEKISYDVEE